NPSNLGKSVTADSEAERSHDWGSVVFALHPRIRVGALRTSAQGRATFAPSRAERACQTVQAELVGFGYRPSDRSSAMSWRNDATGISFRLRERNRPSLAA